jgi:hypothetical protein
VHSTSGLNAILGRSVCHKTELGFLSVSVPTEP